MCQLTLLHGKTSIVKATLGNLTLNNSRGNTDGHGIYFPSLKKYYKTSEDGGEIVFESTYWKRIEDLLTDEETCLISHVRSASIKHKEINLDSAHPHISGNIILMHNGSLEPDDEKLEIKDKIDSYWFADHLRNVCGRKHLRPEHISKAMEDFNGKFAFLIADLRQPDLIYVVRGRTADLGYANYLDGDGNNLCFVINTEKKNISSIIVPMMWRAILGQEIVCTEEKDIDAESIYIYEIPTGTLIKTEEKILETYPKTKPAYVHQHSRVPDTPVPNRNIYTSVAQYDRLAFEICKDAHDMFLTFSELNYLFLMMFGYSILLAESDEIEKLALFLKKLKKTYEGQGEGKKANIWRSVRLAFKEKMEDSSCIELYGLIDSLRFPWFFNANSGLKSVHTSLQKWNPDG